MKEIILLSLNIWGTFLLSVEAIKIKNLRKFGGLLQKSNLFFNPPIEFVDDKTYVGSPNKNKAGFFLFFIAIIFYPVSFALLFTIFQSLNIWVILGLAVIGSFVVWTALIFIIEMTIRFLVIVEIYTPKGFIGMAGFLMLAASFIIDYLQKRG